MYLLGYTNLLVAVPIYILFHSGLLVVDGPSLSHKAVVIFIRIFGTPNFFWLGLRHSQASLFVFFCDGLHLILARKNGCDGVANETPGHFFHRMFLQVGELQLLRRSLREAGIMMYDHVASSQCVS